MKSALITGINGQDGSFLAELLISHGYKVFGTVRPGSNLRNLKSCVQDAELISVTKLDFDTLIELIHQSDPDEIYNLASQSKPSLSWSDPDTTLQINGAMPVNLFEAVRLEKPSIRTYHASSSEMYGQTPRPPQSESTPFNPANPYAVSKYYAHQMAQLYRDVHGIFISCGILFNHESERRPISFLTQKIAYGAACAKLGIKSSSLLNEIGEPIVSEGKLKLGNLDVSRDWGFAGDYVEAMWKMLQQDRADNYVVGTGVLHSLRDICECAYARVGMDWEQHVVSDKNLVRPIDTQISLADASKAREELKWKPSTTFDQLIERMVEAQLEILQATT